MTGRGVYGTYGHGYGYGYGYGRSRPSPRNRKSFFVLGVFLALLLAFYALVLLGQVKFSYRNISVLLGLTFAYALTLADIRIGLILLYFSFGFSPEFEIGGVPNVRIEDFLVPVVLLAWMTQVASRRYRFEPLNVRNPILVLVVVMLFSTLMNIGFRDLSAKRSLFYFLKEIEYFVILLLVVNNIRTERVLRIFIVLTLVICLTSALHSYFIHQSAGGHGRLGGPKGESANVIGAYYLIHMLVASGLLFSVETWRRRLLLIAFLLLMMLPFMRTYSRTSFVALFGALIIVGLLRNRKMLIVAVLLFLLLPIFANQAIIVRFKTVAGIFTGSAPSSWRARVEGWGGHWYKVKKSPLFGHGIGSSGLCIDNEYVKVASELGFIGLAAFLWLLLRMGVTAFRTCNMAEVKLYMGFSLGYFAALVGLSIHCIGTTSFTTIRSMMPFYFLTGMLYVIYNRYTAPEKKVELEMSKFTYTISTDEDRKRLVKEQIERRREPEIEAPPAPT